MAYTTGDTIVHPRHGIATVRGITTRGVGKRVTSYLELSCASALSVLVPMESVDEVGIRQLSTKREAAAILAVLGEPSDVPETWTARSASTSSRMKSTELLQASMVIRDLTRHAQRSAKPLSRAERADLDACVERVSAELSLVLELSLDDVRALILLKAQGEA